MISSGVRRALFEKDLHLFFRDEGQWSQLPLLITLVIIYLFSIKALPLEWGSLVGEAIKYMVAFLNIGIVGVIMASLSSRFLFPSVSMEGRSFWLIQTSPVTLRTFLWSKFLLNFVPMFLMTLILIGFSTYFLHVKTWMVLISMGTALTLSASLTGLSIGMGAIYHNFEAENLSQVQTGFRGAFFMLFAVILIFGTIALEAIPTIGFFLGEVSEGSLVLRAKIMISIFFAAALFLNILFLYIPMRMGEKRLAKL
jgi:ABC-2 type transport system permease protein